MPLFPGVDDVEDIGDLLFDMEMHFSDNGP
jgi:hypothetical protein